MKKIGNALFILMISTLLGFNSLASEQKSDVNNVTPKSDINASVVYGDDDRQDLYEVTSERILHLAHSTLALVRSSDVSDVGNGRSQLRTENFGSAYNLCQEEPFRDQDRAAFCSGFLVAPNKIVTAGHCIRSAQDCSSTKFVFGFGIHNQGDGSPDSVPTQDVYSCKGLIHSEVDGFGADFAVVELDRSVTSDRQPLSLRHSGTVSVGDNLVVIGHPAGLPTKVADGAQVRNVQGGYFIANLDTYGGNSGSAVFNKQTGEVEGILVRGEMDFVYRNGCRLSNRCSNAGCRGEDVTRIQWALPYIN